tara:strand:+ start:676 stop:1497 length:822 start_codon:yes stop_codon:yes gene_type:complete
MSKFQKKLNNKNNHSKLGGKNTPFKKRISKKPKNKTVKEGMRLNQFIAHAGICSRREADQFIAAGLVSINDEVVTKMGYRVKPSDTVKFNNELIKSEKKKYILLNKPKGYICTSDDPKNRKTVMELVRGACKEILYPVGRLHRQTTGLLLFTNDGEMAKKLTNPKHGVKKIYHVLLDKNLKSVDLKKIVEGVNIEEGTAYVEAATYIKNAPKREVGIEIHRGKNSTVRRIFEHLGYNVLRLDRVYFAGLTKKDISRGRHRFLSEQEVAMLKMV